MTAKEARQAVLLAINGRFSPVRITSRAVSFMDLARATVRRVTVVIGESIKQEVLRDVKNKVPRGILVDFVSV